MNVDGDGLPGDGVVPDEEGDVGDGSVTDSVIEA